jgi:non-ribosomal peptide synthetase component F
MAMARIVSQAADALLYEEDFYLWVGRQADLLRKGRFRDLDLAHLIEEVEDLGANRRNAVTSRVREIILHLLKLEHSPAAEPRRGWYDSVGKHRDDLELEITPSLRRHVAAELDSIFQKARRRAVDDLAQDRVKADQLPMTCPYTFDQIVGPVWRPNNVHGIEDPAP